MSAKKMEETGGEAKTNLAFPSAMDVAAELSLSSAGFAITVLFPSSDVVVVVVVVVVSSSPIPTPPRAGKLTFASSPRIFRAASSYFRAASLAVLKVPSQSLTPFRGSLISAAHFPQGRRLTPL